MEGIVVNYQRNRFKGFGSVETIKKKLWEKGWIEKLTNYSHELKKSPEFLINEFKKEMKEVNPESSKVSWVSNEI